MVDLLFDYTYNLGDAELASDQDIEVKTRFETTEARRDLERNGGAHETMKPWNTLVCKCLNLWVILGL